MHVSVNGVRPFFDVERELERQAAVLRLAHERGRVRVNGGEVDGGGEP